MKTERAIQIEATAVDTAAAITLPEGVVVAPVEGGMWNALRELRTAMRQLGTAGKPRATYLSAIARDGREVRGSDPAAAILLLGYQV